MRPFATWSAPRFLVWLAVFALVTGAGVDTATAAPARVAAPSGPAEGIHDLQYRSQQDLTPPEFYSEFNPETRDVAVYARDTGIDQDDAQCLSVFTPTRWGQGDGVGDGGTAQLLTCGKSDPAGNTSTLVAKVKRDSQQQDSHLAKVRMLSVQYQNDPPIALPVNEQSFAWSIEKDGSLKELGHQIVIGEGKDRQRVFARFDVKKNETVITEAEQNCVKPGLALLRLATDQGELVIENGCEAE